MAYWDSRERIVRRTYDAIGRILTESVDGTVQETYHYDLVPDQMGRLGRVDDNAGSVAFSYDALGGVTGRRVPCSASYSKLDMNTNPPVCKRK